ncbi:DNA-binding transcriptional LysR family regulator [Rhizobium sp. SG_E_25_P2]|jgi:DNA-binding transcriptional LysR family regulator|uniref:LysR family transcriptional regulator n=1 Tax=Rhizobium sp. SG_E_25_P2 TaxID=2879942 RepID=UPI0024740EB5|nr:LysR family transcriptional regulator [Rhizobium sp. SG_E_25_P2]MDH6267333.1 DNA-binding transcriptional LysR family regulator [Rhizobium sp. SG_E_25_P2]
MVSPIASSLPTLELDILKTFVAIADTGNFTTAAERVFRTPSAVSMQIKKLEEQLAVSLFRRDARSVSLTHNGEILLGYARRMLAMNNEVVSRFVTPDMAGVVRLGSPDDIGTLMLPAVLRHFAEMFPSLAVDVMIDNSVPLKRAVAEGKLDLTLFNFLDPSISPNPAERVMTEQLVWVGKKNGQAHLREPLPLSVWDEGCIWRKRAIEELTRSGRHFRVAYFCGHHMGQLAAIQADLAIAPLARFMVQSDMTVLGEAEGLPNMGHYDIGLAVGEEPSAPVKAVADYIRMTLANRGVERATAAAA